MSSHLLRQLIRETLLVEGMTSPDEAAKMGLIFDVYSGPRTIVITMIDVDPLGDEKIVGYMRAVDPQPPLRGGTWVVEDVESKIRGLGPLMYELMIDLIHPMPLASDRTEVSPQAIAVWERFLQRASASDGTDFVAIPTTQGKVAGEALMYGYRRPLGAGTPTLDRLKVAGRMRPSPFNSGGPHPALLNLDRT